MKHANKGFSLKHKLYPILLALAHLLVGVLLLVNPEAFSAAVVVVAGVWLAVMGVLSLIHYFRDDPRHAVLKQEFALGLLLLVVGLFLTLNPGFLVRLFPAMVMVYGVVVLLGSFRYMQMAMDFRRLKLPFSLVMLVAALVQLLMAILFLLNPFETTAVAFTFIGVFLIVTGLFSLVMLVLERLSPARRAVELRRSDAPAEKEATIPSAGVASLMPEDAAPVTSAPTAPEATVVEDMPAPTAPTLDTPAKASSPAEEAPPTLGL